MEKVYDPKLIESKWKKFWDENNCFAFENFSQGNNFCIMLPPPNVTGNLHMGHAFQHTMMDILVRLNMMQGKKVLWQAGLDHAGISTQMVVEKQLANNNIKRTELSREEFVSKVWEWKKKYGGVIIEQMQRLGTAVDWSLAKFTLDPDFSFAVKKVFIQLYREGLIYKGQKLINWDPKLQTAISDLEVVMEEISGSLWYIKYPLLQDEQNLNEDYKQFNYGNYQDEYGYGNGLEQGFIIIATTRPETLLGDVAICVNPSDKRYEHLIGKFAILPIVNKKIPIIGDDYVDQEFGTGCLKITPAHDYNDYAIAMRHHLKPINIFNKDLTLNENVPLEYQGLTKLEARSKILANLKVKGLLFKEEECTISIPKSSNTNVIVEPFLTEQWFVSMKNLASPAIDAVKTGKIKFIPEEWSANYLEWLHNIQDWCISRQLWWGHQIPAWYDDKGNIYVGEDLTEVKSYYSLPKEIKLTQEIDVLDTWFSAALWPFVTLGWPNETPAYRDFFPTNVLVTGFDIIFFWVARMIMFSIKFTGQVPFKTICIHGIIQDQDGHKMSKTRGNVIDPIDLVDGISLEDLLVKRTTGLMQPQYKNIIEQKTKQQFPQGINNFGTDALRFTFCAIATHNRHIKFELSRLEGYRNFCNKLWNAARFLLLHIENEKFDLAKITCNFNNFMTFVNGCKVIEIPWVLSIWQTVKLNFLKHLNNYRFDLAAQEIYDFTWNEYCDWLVEFSKIRLFDPQQDLEVKHSIKLILIYIFDELLKVLHIIMPYLTEEIWCFLQQHIISNDKLNIRFTTESKILLHQKFPVFNETFLNLDAEKEMLWVKSFITTIRNLRANNNIPNKVMIPMVFVGYNLSNVEKKYLLHNKELIKKMSKIERIIIDQKNIEDVNYVLNLKSDNNIKGNKNVTHDDSIDLDSDLSDVNVDLDDLSALDSNLNRKRNSIIGMVNQTEIWFLIDGLIDKQLELNRINKEINKLNSRLIIINNKLNNPQYLQNAPLDIVKKDQQKQMEFQLMIDKLKNNLDALN